MFLTDRDPPDNPDWDLPPEPEQIPEPVNGAQPAPEDPPQDGLDQTPKPYNGDGPAADAREA